MRPKRVINQALHDHVTGSAFHLSLTKSHIAYLEHLKQYGWQTFADRMEYDHRRENPLVHRMWTVAIGGLISRGLLLHRMDLVKGDTRNGLRLNQVFELTAAGEAACTLLTEAGLIDPTQMKKQKKKEGANS